MKGRAEIWRKRRERKFKTGEMFMQKTATLVRNKKKTVNDETVKEKQ